MKEEFWDKQTFTVFDTEPCFPIKEGTLKAERGIKRERDKSETKKQGENSKKWSPE